MLREHRSVMIFSAQLTSCTSMRSVHSTSWLKTPLMTERKAGSSRVMRQPADHVGVLQERDEQCEVGDVELAVGVGEGGVVEVGRAQAVAHRRAIARLVLVAHDLQVHAELFGDGLRHVAGAVGGSVVDDDHVELLGERGSTSLT